MKNETKIGPRAALKSYKGLPLASRLVSRGMTLLEALVYVVILSLLILFLMSALLSIIQTIVEIRISRALNYSAVVALERMVRDIREAGDVDELSSVFDVHPGELTVVDTDPYGNSTTTRFYLSLDDILNQSINGGAGSALTSSDLEISNLVFRHIVSSSSQAAKIEISLRNREGRRIIERIFYNTAVLRGSYE